MKPGHNYEPSLLNKIIAYAFLIVVYVVLPALAVNLILQGNWIYGIAHLQLALVFTLVIFQVAKI